MNEIGWSSFSGLMSWRMWSNCIHMCIMPAMVAVEKTVLATMAFITSVSKASLAWFCKINVMTVIKMISHR